MEIGWNNKARGDNCRLAVARESGEGLKTCCSLEAKRRDLPDDKCGRERDLHSLGAIRSFGLWSRTKVRGCKSSK